MVFCINKGRTMKDTQLLLLSTSLLLLSVIDSTFSKTIIPANNCFKSLPLPITAEASAEAVVAPPADFSGQTRDCGTPFCIEEGTEDSGRTTDINPPIVPTDTIFFIADKSNTCIFWRCIGRGKAIMMQCAPGSKLSNNYIGGSSNPCTQRYFKLRATTCVRPGPVITTLEPPKTLPGGISIPIEITGITRESRTTIEVPTEATTASPLQSNQEAATEAAEAAQEATAAPETNQSA